MKIYRIHLFGVEDSIEIEAEDALNAAFKAGQTSELGLGIDEIEELSEVQRKRVPYFMDYGSPMSGKSSEVKPRASILKGRLS